ncbi:MAG TPA: hypothetical protein G4O02_02980 [Caldilineae bacterium]|nr:hypothetical protein [Caldilineae bacterium]
MINLESRVRAMRAFLWFFRGSTLLYVAIGWLIYRLLGGHGGLVNLPRSTYLLVLVVMALAGAATVGVLTFFLPARLTNPERLAQLPGMNRRSAVVAQLQRAFMIAVSGANLVAMLGLVLFLLNGQMPHLIAFTLAALIVLGMTTPEQERWEETVRAVRARRSDWVDVW